MMPSASRIPRVLVWMFLGGLLLFTVGVGLRVLIETLPQ
jgi:hypothetical protein